MKKTKYLSKKADSSGLISWTEEENKTWEKLLTRQTQVVQGRACLEFLQGVELLKFSQKKVPQLPEINQRLDQLTGWGVEPVAAIIPPKEFFSLLSRKRFPAATFIRVPEDLDYIQEPDIFHEIYGHTPLLTNAPYADFMQKFGELGLKVRPQLRKRLFRLFWFTIEFGLIKTDQGMRAYGGGILSSIGETQYCLTSQSEKKGLSIRDILKTPYRVDIMQPLYFFIESFHELFALFEQDIQGALEQTESEEDYKPKFPPKEVGEAAMDQKGLMPC